ncbi:DUF6794 domain-containing protein [Pyxidicoccus sp. 3LG]
MRSPLSLPLLLSLALLGGCERRGEPSAPAPQKPAPAPPAPRKEAVCAVPQQPLTRPLPAPPATVREAGQALTEHLSEDAKAFLRCEAEVERVVAALHFSVGREVRNQWVRPSGGAALRANASQWGIADPDGISAIIVVAAHATLRPQGGDPSKAIEGYRQRRGALQ